MIPVSSRPTFCVFVDVCVCYRDSSVSGWRGGGGGVGWGWGGVVDVCVPALCGSLVMSCCGV